MIHSILALALSWLSVLVDCHGMPEAQPVTYLVPFSMGEMVMRDGCPLSEFDTPQECATWTRVEWDTGTATEFDIPDPPVGQVYVATDPIAVDPSGNRSDDPCL